MPKSKMVKAYLTITSPSGSSSTYNLKFNPNEYTYSKTASWKRVPSVTAPNAGTAQFIGSGPRSLSVEIFLDQTDSPSASIMDDLDTIFSTLSPTSASISSGKPLPPSVVFGWGSTVSFQAYVSKVEAQVTLFRSDGTPSRATCTLMLREIPTTTPRQNPTSGALATYRTHTVVAGDSLASIAYGAYGRADQWRAIAAVNAIDDPTRLGTGRQLLIPPREDVAQWA